MTLALAERVSAEDQLLQMLETQLVRDIVCGHTDGGVIEPDEPLPSDAIYGQIDGGVIEPDEPVGSDGR